MKKLAIVSSYNEECGAAFYSTRLLKHFTAAGYSVDIKRLPVSLLRVSRPSKIRRKGDAEIARIANELADYDGVLLQFEPGLYGTTAKSSYRRVRRLLQAAKRAIITVHGFDRAVTGSTLVGAAASFASGKFSDGLYDLRQSIFGQGKAQEVERFWTWVKDASHVHTVTFCKADQSLLQRYFDLTRISNYPITYYDEEEVSSIRESVDRERFMRQFGLDPSKKYISVCGFLSPYKGHLTAIKALEFLPDDWHLAIVGGEHPQGLEANKDIGSYVRQLLAFSLESEASLDGRMELGRMQSNQYEGVPSSMLNRMDIKQQVFKRSDFKYFLPKTELQSRIKFLGQVSDDDMPRMYAGLDYFVHPYIKTKSGQSGSGPATLAMEFGTKALFSNAPVFREMNQYFPGSMSFFNVGNFIELAESLGRFDNFEKEYAVNRNQALKVYNPAGMTQTYREILGF